MKAIIIYSFFFLFLPISILGQTTKDEDSIRISLLTCSPGEELYSLFGHTAIRYEEPLKGVDIVFNYGMFSFNAPNFALRFALGETDYILGVEDYRHFAAEYSFYNRSVKQQILNLKVEEKERLIQLLQENYLPQNRTYRYNFFYDNCATRPLDKIRESINGEIIFPDLLNGRTVTYRDVVHQFTQGHPWASFGFDLCLGARADQPISIEQSMFAPFYLMEAFNGAEIDENGQKRPLVLKTETIIESVPSTNVSIWNLFSPFICSVLLLLIIVLIAIRSIRRKKDCWILHLILFASAGLAGCIFAFLALFSSHPAVDRNYVLFLLHPGHLLFLPYIIYCTRKGKKCWYLTANSLVLTLFIAFFPLIPQEFDGAVVPLALGLLTLSVSHLIINHKKKA